MSSEMQDLTAVSAGDGSPGELSFLWLEITGKCNLECIHCYANSGPRQQMRGKMHADDWLAVLQESAELGCRQVQFIGGEPTLHPDLLDMISFAAVLNYRFIEVFSNATTLDAALLQFFSEKGVRIATSFYSDSPDIHESITKQKGSFARTVAGLKRALSMGVPVRAGIIEMAANSGHVERAQAYLRNLGVTEINVDHQREVGRGVRKSDRSAGSFEELCGECWKGKLCVTSMGRTYPCVFSRFIDLGDSGEGLSRILSGHRLLGFRSGFRNYLADREPNIGELQSTESAPEAGGEPSHLQREGVSSSSQTCSPGQECGPTRTCSPCGPEFFCVPKGPSPCSPNRPCAPALQPGPSCIPETIR